MIAVNVPVANQPAKVVGTGTTGKICARGTAHGGKDETPVEVAVKVYTTGSPPPNPPPSSPPPGSVQATLSGYDWSVSEVGTADRSDTSPYPDNALLVWARYYNNGPYERAAVSFQGKSATTTDCG